MADAAETYRIGIDVGGTFTDVYVWSSRGEVSTYKVLSTPEDPSVGVLDALRVVADDQGLSVEHLGERIRTIVHGTTVTTNAVITRCGARCGLLTTEGVRDALEMRRGIREEQYDNRYTNVPPLVRRWLRRPVAGRFDWRGEEVTPLDLDSVREAVQLLKSEGVEALAICLMNAFANPDHERAAAELVRSEMPDAFLSVSSKVLPTIRFYDRVSTTVLNAYAGPVLDRYLESLTRRLGEVGFAGVLLVMQSSGGLAAPEVVRQLPATTLLSGPAAGPRAGLAFVEAVGQDSCLVVDMGGTSFDASLVRDGEMGLEAHGEIDRLRIALPMLDIVTIGAGGGSIGWIDAGGLLRMGPQSAGASPGPACYGRGGALPTSTDADLVLGYLDPEWFAGGKLRLSADAARAAITEHVARPLGLETEEAAAGMYRVINTNMAHGVREITIKRGLDPREFPMVIAGGAGALHACAIASELDIPTVVVPQVASILCASGMLLTDLQHDHVQSYVAPLAEVSAEALDAIASRMEDHGHEQLRNEGIEDARISHQVSLDLRYLKQYHEVTVPVDRGAVRTGDWQAVAGGFHAAHDRLFGYELSEEGTAVELINVRVRSTGRVDTPPLPRVGEAPPGSAPERKGARRAFVPEKQAFEEVPVFDGHTLRAGNRIPGPALIDRTDTTIFLSGAFSARVDAHGTCVLEGGER